MKSKLLNLKIAYTVFEHMQAAVDARFNTANEYIAHLIMQDKRMTPKKGERLVLVDSWDRITKELR